MNAGHGHVLRRARRAEVAEDEGRIRFLSWYFRSRFDLMQRFLEDLERPTTPLPLLRRRFLDTTRHANRVLVARAVVTFLLALGVLAALAATVASAVWVPGPFEAGVAATSRFLAQAAAVSTSASVVLLVLRLAFDRYLGLVDTCATFLGMQIAASTSRPTTRGSA